MLYRVDFTQPSWRWVFGILYKRVEDFALAHDMSLEAVRSRFSQLLQGDPNIYLVVETEAENIMNISAHALFVIQPLTPDTTYIFIEQLEADESFIKQGFLYAEQVVAPEHNATRISMVTDVKKYRAFGKKYGFEPYKVLMNKEIAGV